MSKQVGQYHVLFYQPSPELGERVAVGLLFEEQPLRFYLHFEPDFPKLRRLYPKTDVEIVRFCLEDLRKSLLTRDDPQRAFSRYSPQLVRSEPRRLALPLKATTVEMLAKSILSLQRAHRDADGQTESGRPTTTVMIADAIEKFVLVDAGVDLHSKRDVDASLWTRGTVRGLKKVAFAVESPSGWTLLDGVDLNVMTPAQAEKHADSVAKNFWQYRRFGEERLGGSIQTIGLVMNGYSHLNPTLAAAHDFALHRLSGDSDLTLDTSEGSAVDRLRKQLLGHP